VTSLLDRNALATGDAGGTKSERGLPTAPRTRKPLMIAGSAAVVFVSIAAFATIYSSSNHQSSVLVVTRTIQQGQQITGRDLGQSNVAISGGVTPILVADAPELAGKRAAVTIPAGSLLVAGDLTGSGQIASGDAVVGLALKDGELPSGGVETGERVMIVQTAGPGGSVASGSSSSSISSISSGQFSGTGGVATGVLVPQATVFGTAAPSVNSTNGATQLVSVEVSATLAAEVSTAAAADQVSLALLPSDSAGGATATGTTPDSGLAP
jgi:hypothetical protein